MSDSLPSKAPTYRPFRSDDISAAHALSATIRWPHRADDWRFMFQTGSGFVAEDNGAVIGTALYWKFGEHYGTLGLVIVSAQEQGRGIGRQLMEQVLEALGSRTTFLYATPAGKRLYEKLGFDSCGTLDQHQGTVGSTAAVAPTEGYQLRPPVASDLPKLIELASRGCGFDRSAVLPALLDVAQGVVLERGGELAGFSLLRRFGSGYAIGPVVTTPSPDEQLAKSLISYWLAKHAGDVLRIDVPGGTGISDWLIALGMTRVDSVTRMVRNAPAQLYSGEPDAAYRMFGIINHAMG
ncbi:GNAT family N-acetyltransferase [Paraburkholderia dilworthii]|uniref:GNAT family N-acetyltransferase n=1 Tax=Paraburkholderia dilworthii TaxID=948106 RepID=UPI00042065C5|nr:GNAT family N-acetyltransferase [Paraburkholderia dilworthii]